MNAETIAAWNTLYLAANGRTIYLEIYTEHFLTCEMELVTQEDLYDGHMYASNIDKKAYVELRVVEDHDVTGDPETLCYNIPTANGDVNGDGDVNIQDIVIIVNAVVTESIDELTDAGFCAGDMNEDGMIDVLDIVEIVNNVLG